VDTSPGCHRRRLTSEFALGNRERNAAHGPFEDLESIIELPLGLGEAHLVDDAAEDPIGAPQVRRPSTMEITTSRRCSKLLGVSLLNI